MNKNKRLELNLLPDKPVLKTDPNYYEFYHDYISPALQKLIRENKETSTIGLFGDWGSGKSTIIDNLKGDFSDYPVFVFDTWKYQHDPLRRTFLIKLYEYINDPKNTKIGWKEGKGPKATFLDDLYISYTEENDKMLTQSEVVSKNYFSKLWDNIRSNPAPWLIGGVLVAVTSMWLSAKTLGAQNSWAAWVVQVGLQVLGIIGISSTATAFVGVVGKEFITTLTKWLLEDVKGKVKTQKIIETREALNSPEQFEAKFGIIVESVDSDMVIVFDNTDRINPDLAIQTLSTIKTFFDPTDKTDKQIVFVIPCDSEAILDRIKQHYKIKDDYKASEYLRKLFNVSLWTPEFINSDIEDFIKKTIPQLGKDADKLDNENLFILLNQAFGNRTNPREIKQFLNNLVATLHVANGTDVGEIVLGNVAYMAKVLTLKQKFPKQYLRLKSLFFDPEKIWGDKDNPEYKDDPPEFNEFMLNTSMVTTLNAEPFIYFKKPNQSKDVKNDEKLTVALLSEDSDLTNKIIEENQNNTGALVSFVLGLYKKYKLYPEFLFKLVNTFLHASVETGIAITGSSYFNQTADIIYKYIWNKYRELDTKLVFDVFIKNAQTHKDIREQLMDRYIEAIASEELKGKIDEVSVIISELISTKLINDSQIQKIRSTVETRYSREPQIIGLFESAKQDTYITSRVITSYLEVIDINNFSDRLSILLNYKKHINKLGLTPDLLQKLEELITNERQDKPQSSERKNSLFNIVDKFIFEPDSILLTPGPTPRGKLLMAVNDCYANAGTIDSKYYIVPSLYILMKYLDGPQYQPQVTASNNYINQFIQQSTIESLRTLIDYFAVLNKDKEFINEYVSSYVGRAVTNGAEEIDFCYALMDIDEQQAVINGIIEHRVDAGLGFVEKLDKLPKRLETISKYLDRATKLQPQDRTGVYNWVKQNLKINDDPALKNEAVFQIRHLLTSDLAAHQEAAYNFLDGSSFINETQKREIGDGVLEWFRTPGKLLNQNHRFAIKSVALLYSTLDVTRKAYFVYELFRMLSNHPDRLVAEVALESLVGIGIRVKDYKDYFVDFKENIITWPEGDVKQYVKADFMKLKPSKGTKFEKEYWDEIEKV